MSKNSDLLTIAVRAAESGAASIRSATRPRDPDTWDRKGLNDFVTEVDRTAERIIGDALLKDGPDAVILGEELTPDAGTEGLVWVVDPLDGTTNYLHGYPSYCVSIAGVIDGVPHAAVVLDVSRGGCYTAARGEGAWNGDTRLAVSAVTEPASALIGTGFPFKHPRALPEYADQLVRVLRTTSGVRRAGSAALDLVDVACGRFDGFWELFLAPWDVAAGTLLVRESGGFVTNTSGSTDVICHGSIVAGNPKIHAWLLGQLTSG